jgi:hypothetical protein
MDNMQDPNLDMPLLDVDRMEGQSHVAQNSIGAVQYPSNITWASSSHTQLSFPGPPERNSRQSQGTEGRWEMGFLVPPLPPFPRPPPRPSPSGFTPPGGNTIGSQNLNSMRKSQSCPKPALETQHVRLYTYREPAEFVHTYSVVVMLTTRHHSGKWVGEVSIEPRSRPRKIFLPKTPYVCIAKLMEDPALGPLLADLYPGHVLSLPLSNPPEELSKVLPEKVNAKLRSHNDGILWIFCGHDGTDALEMWSMQSHVSDFYAQHSFHPWSSWREDRFLFSFDFDSFM